MNLVKEYREKKKLTQQELADKVGVSVRTIQSIEQNLRKPSTNLMLSIFKILNIPLSRLEIFLNSYTTK